MKVGDFMFTRAFAVITVGAVAGILSATAIPTSAQVEEDCENDRCARACVGETCAGDCFDSPESDRACDMDGEDCSSSSCEPE